MTKGRHKCGKSKTDPTYDPQWSGVSYAPVASGKKCPQCGGHVHKEGDSHYCPYCDDYVRAVSKR